MNEIAQVLRMLRVLRETAADSADFIRSMDLDRPGDTATSPDRQKTHSQQPDSQTRHIPQSAQDHLESWAEAPRQGDPAQPVASGTTQDDLANFERLRESHLAREEADEDHSNDAPSDAPGTAAHVRDTRRKRDDQSLDLARFSDAAQIRSRFELQNFHAASLSGVGGTDSPRPVDGKGGGDLPQVSKQLADAAAKMDKAFSHGKTVMVVGD